MENLYRWLTTNGHSQEWLSKQVGVTQVGVSHWMVKRTSPSTESLIKLSEITGLTLEQLLDREKA